MFMDSVKKAAKGISMVEIMLTVLIISTCLIVVLRGFSICAAAISQAYNTILAVDILEEKIADIKEKAILEGGIWDSSYSEDIVKNGRNFQYNKLAIEWKDKSEEVSGEEKTSSYKMYEVTLTVLWLESKKSGGVGVKTVLPAKGLSKDF